MGLRLDLVLRKLDGSRAGHRKTVGAEMAHHGNYLRDFTPWDEQDSAKIKSYFHSARKFGIWAPDDDQIDLNRPNRLVTDYLTNVGTQLQNGHFKEAKQYAKESKARFSASKR